MEASIASITQISLIETVPESVQALQDAAKRVRKLRQENVNLVNSKINLSGSEDDRRRLQLGLFYLILIEPDQLRPLLTDLILLSRDNLKSVVDQMKFLLVELWSKMVPDVKQSFLALFNELIATPGINLEEPLHALLRRLQCGDLSQVNLWLIDRVTGMLMTNLDWLTSPDRSPGLLALVVFTLLRLIPDHVPIQRQQHHHQLPQMLADLRQREIQLVDQLIRSHFDRVLGEGGRDLLRLLHSVARLDRMKRLWHDMLTNIASFSTKHTSIAPFFDKFTPIGILVTAVPFEMELWIKWMMRNVKREHGVPMDRYQEIFQCPIVTANSKLAMFYDWMFFKPEDSILNLEPTLLAITQQLSPRAHLIALTLVDFLVKIVPGYYPPMTERIVTSIRQGLDKMVNMGVVTTIVPLLDLIGMVSIDLLRSFRMLLGIEPVPLPQPQQPTPDEQQQVANSRMTPPIGRPTTPPLPQSIGGGGTTPPPIPSSSSSAAASANAKSLPAGSPLISPPKDPRLTRGHAARGLPLSQPTPTSGSLSPISNFEPPPRLTRTGSSFRQPPPCSPTSSVNNEPVSNLFAKVTSTASSSSPSRTPPTASIPSSSTESAASWSPPHVDLSSPNNGDMIDPDQYISNGLPQLQPEMMELTIESLRRKFHQYGLEFVQQQKNQQSQVSVDALIKQVGEQEEAEEMGELYLQEDYGGESGSQMVNGNEFKGGRLTKALGKLRDFAVSSGLFKEPNNSKATQNGIATVSEVSANSVDDAEGGEVDNEVTESVSFRSRLRSTGLLTDLCDAMEDLVQAALSNDSFDDLVKAGRVADIVCQLTSNLFGHRLTPHPPQVSLDSDSSKLEEFLQYPIFVPFRHLWQMSPGDPKRELLLLLLTEMHSRQPRLGYHLLFFIKFGKLNDPEMNIYRTFCASQDSPNLRESLFNDLRVLANDNRLLFCHLLPDIVCAFKQELVNNADFLHLLVSLLDPVMCNNVFCSIVRGHLELIDADKLGPILETSLKWESFEQMFFWQLISAHDIPILSFGPLVQIIDPYWHSEACTNILTLLKLERPSPELVSLLLNRPSENDLLTVSAIHYWSTDDSPHSNRLGQLIASFIAAQLTLLSTGQLELDAKDRRRLAVRSTAIVENPVDLKLILMHLDWMRKTCKDVSFLQNADIQLALHSVSTSPRVDDALKDHYTDLLALVGDDEDDDQPTSPHNSLGSSPISNVPSTGSSSSKGGHRLRNLDSRRAAEVERRRTIGCSDSTPTPSIDQKTSSPAIKPINISSSSSDEDNERQDIDLDGDGEEAKLTIVLSSPSSSSSDEAASCNKPPSRRRSSTKPGGGGKSKVPTSSSSSDSSDDNEATVKRTSRTSSRVDKRSLPDNDESSDGEEQKKPRRSFKRRRRLVQPVDDDDDD